MISLKQYDTSRAIERTLSLGGVPLVLTGATVTMVWRRLPYGEPVSHAVDIITAVSGEVSYQPTAGDMAEAGDFEVEWKIVFPSGDRITVPTRNRDRLKIYPALA